MATFPYLRNRTHETKDPYPMVVAVTCGLGASYMTSRLLAERTPEDNEKVVVLVAKKNLDMGVTIKKVDDLFEEKKFTKGDEPKNAIVKVEDLQARVSESAALRSGDFVTGDDFLSDKDGGISTLMAQGYRAIGIRVNIPTSRPVSPACRCRASI